MMIIGLIGRIGAGKSTVARRFAQHGATVVDADRHAHEVLEDPQVIAEVAGRFGPGVLNSLGRIDRAALAGIVFGTTPDHDTARAGLEAIVHPRVRHRQARSVNTRKPGQRRVPDEHVKIKCARSKADLACAIAAALTFNVKERG